MIFEQQKKNFLKSALAISIFSFSIFSCNTQYNNPFLPKAELTITDVKAGKVTGGSGSGKTVGVYQSFKKADGSSFLVANYSFVDPEITIQNKIGLPRVIFKQLIVEHTIKGKKLPSVVYPITITVPAGSSLTTSIPVLSNSEDIISTVFPNHTFNAVNNGFSEATLLGLDDNGYLTTIKFSTSTAFETDPTNTGSPENIPTPKPTDEPSRFSPTIPG